MSKLDRDVPDHGLTALIGQLAENARDVARAEIGLVRARVGDNVARYRTAAMLFAVAGVLSLAGFIALLVGLIDTLAPRIGPGWATTVVCGAIFAAAAVLALLGKNRLAPRIRK